MSKKKGDLLMRKRLYILLTAIVPFSILLLAGCGGSASLGSRALPDNDWPKKGVMVMPASDLSGAGFNELIDTVSGELAKILGKTGFFNVYHQDKTKKFPLFKPGEPADPGLMREAREMGMNAIIFETVNPIETNPVRGGIWPFRKKAGRLTVSINIDVLDVNRGTILVSREIAEDVTVSDEEAKGQKQKSTDVETKKRALKECLPDIVKKAARVASLSLNQEVWSCRIVSADKKGIIINAGHDAGLRPGTVFEVFAQGESITSCKGQTHRLPGPKVGEIKISSIKPRHSSAQPINGTGFKTGQIVRVKD